MTSIPASTWTRKLDAVLERPGAPNRMFDFKTTLKSIPLVTRLMKMARANRSTGMQSWNVLNAAKPGPVAGVPLGGIGGGSIGRGWRGDFNRFSIRPGIIHHSHVPADQFALFSRRPGRDGQAVTLSPVKPTDGTLASWNWGLNPACATYHALFPRAWTTYDEPLPGLQLTCKQVSPFIPHNYRESSFPEAVFEWTIENTGSEKADVALMFSFQNGWGTPNDKAGGHANRAFFLGSGRERVSGVALHHLHRQIRTRPPESGKAEPFETIEDPITFALAVRPEPGLKITRCHQFATSGDGSDIWQDFARCGELSEVHIENPSDPGESIGAALAVSCTLQPGQTRVIPFALAWDQPVVHSGFGTPWLRRYTVFYGSKGDAAPCMAQDALTHYPDWEKAIETWQSPVLTDPDLPDWYKHTLFNETYFISEGGTFWVYPADSKPDPDKMGHFGYLEGHEYRMVNTYDVHFYASIAMLMLFPRIQTSITRDFAATVGLEHPQVQEFYFSNEKGPRKTIGAVPHDLGWPDEDPFHLVNGYSLHDSGIWKDLNPKFILQVYRDAVLTRDLKLLKDTWGAVQQAFDRSAAFDRDGDGLIENDAFPDQTYDTWTVTGPSAYTGGLWLATLAAMAGISRLLHKSAEVERYTKHFAGARQAYIDKLWNGEYFNYDSSASPQHDSVMADQLCGQWFADMSNLPPLVPQGHIRSALKAIFKRNVRMFGGGEMGAVNGIRPDGSPDRTNIQSVEVWTGTTYALAAAMIQQGMVKEAFETARGIYLTGWERKGYWFATPEAWVASGNYRSLAYMRPLAIWGVQHAWEQRISKK